MSNKHTGLDLQKSTSQTAVVTARVQKNADRMSSHNCRFSHRHPHNRQLESAGKIARLRGQACAIVSSYYWGGVVVSTTGK